jgi:hypothetical protein
MIVEIWEKRDEKQRKIHLVGVDRRLLLVFNGQLEFPFLISIIIIIIIIIIVGVIIILIIVIIVGAIIIVIIISTFSSFLGATPTASTIPLSLVCFLRQLGVVGDE